MRLPRLRRRTVKPQPSRPLPFTEAQVRERAYKLWQANPEGSAEAHWEGAIRELKRERSPVWRTKRLLGLAFTAETPGEALDVVKVVVSTLGLLATVTAGVGLYLNYQQGQEKLVTDRFAKAVEQLGSKEPDVRIGAIYSLERIAKDSPKDQGTIMEVLTAYVRNKSPLPKDWKPNSKQQLADVTTDVQAVLSVMGRREVKNDPQGKRLKLGFNNLRGANFYFANLTDTNFDSANLEGAYLMGANLNGASLIYANLEGANLYGANLRDTYLYGANLKGAFLKVANLKGAFNLTTDQIKAADNWQEACYDPSFSQQLGLPLKSNSRLPVAPSHHHLEPVPSQATHCYQWEP